MPPIVLSIISIIQIATKAGPVVKEVYAEALKLFTMLFQGGVITIEQQAKLLAWAEAHQAAVESGDVPPELQVEPDPSGP